MTELEKARDDLLMEIGSVLTGNSKMKLCVALDAFKKARKVITDETPSPRRCHYKGYCSGWKTGKCSSNGCVHYRKE